MVIGSGMPQRGQTGLRTIRQIGLFAEQDNSPKRTIRRKGQFAERDNSPKGIIRRKGQFAERDNSPKIYSVPTKILTYYKNL